MSMFFPEWVEPMAATLTQERFTGPEWTFERKFDGIRLLAYRRGQDVDLFSRNRLPQNCPSIARAIADLPVDDAILDGEITWSQVGPVYHVFAGKVGTGFDTALLLDLRARFDALEILKSPFTKAIGLPRVRAHWVRPEIVVQVAFIEWTVHGKLRHSRFLGVRTDKSAREVVREVR